MGKEVGMAKMEGENGDENVGVACSVMDGEDPFS